MPVTPAKLWVGLGEADIGKHQHSSRLRETLSHRNKAEIERRDLAFSRFHMCTDEDILPELHTCLSHIHTFFHTGDRIIQL